MPKIPQWRAKFLVTWTLQGPQGETRTDDLRRQLEIAVRHVMDDPTIQVEVYEEEEQLLPQVDSVGLRSLRDRLVHAYQSNGASRDPCCAICGREEWEH